MRLVPTLGQIREEGLARSQVMEHIRWLAAVCGPRLTGTPAISQASDRATRPQGRGSATGEDQQRS